MTQRERQIIQLIEANPMISQQELADKLGVSRQTINAIEKGDYNPTIKLCVGICRVLGLTLNDLFWNEESIDIFEKK